MRNKKLLTPREITVFGMLGALMFVSKVAMEALPNIHPLAMLIVAFTVVYRRKALIPIYIYVFLNGLFGGFSLWWVPYLYIWTVLWGMTMLVPQNLNKKYAPFVYCFLCGLHGILYGCLYAPAQALMFGLSFKGMLAWIAAGLPFDIAHAEGNILIGILTVPVITILRKLEGRT